MTQEGWDTPRTDDDLAYEEAWEHARAQETEREEEEGTVRDSLLIDRFSWNSRDGVTFDAGAEEERERAQTLIDEAISDDE